MKIDYRDLVPFELISEFPIEAQLIYAAPDHENNHFGSLYNKDARLWLHHKIAAITIGAAIALNKEYFWKLKLVDCLRTVEAQQIMQLRGYDPTLVSKPGSGAHPRGMAIDIVPIDNKGNLVEMGTPFDYFTKSIDDNPAARNYSRF